MTYYSYSGMRSFKDGRTCGSDCNSGLSPTGLTCTNDTHLCLGTGTATQDEIKIIQAVFGPAGAKAPTLSLTSPVNGSAQASGFGIDANCSSSDGIQEVDVYIDGLLRSSLTTAPYHYTAPTSLKDGQHTVKVICATKLQATAQATAAVVIGAPCQDDSNCPANYMCWSGACVAGPNAPGGLGAACTDSSQCVNGTCASDGNQMLCVISCDLTNDMCPDGFGCLEAGAGGVCWLGAEKAGGDKGCCSLNASPSGSLLLGFGVLGLLVRRRRRVV
jgi:hypothetical protein